MNSYQVAIATFKLSFFLKILKSLYISTRELSFQTGPSRSGKPPFPVLVQLDFKERVAVVENGDVAG